MSIGKRNGKSCSQCLKNHYDYEEKLPVGSFAEKVVMKFQWFGPVSRCPEEWKAPGGIVDSLIVVSVAESGAWEDDRVRTGD
jgi:hypothetical protein